MARFFDVTTPVTTLALDEKRAGEVAFTVSNATPRSIRGEASIVPSGGAQEAWFTVHEPVRAYPADGAEQVSVSVAVPPDAPPGDCSFRLRILLGGGVPEEDFDDSQSVSFTVPEPPLSVPPPPKKPFPWWILLVIGAILALIALAVVGFVLTRPGASPSPSPTPPASLCPAPEAPDVEFLPDLEILNVLYEQGASGVRVFALINNNAVGDGAAGPFQVRFRLDRQVRDWNQADGLLPGGQFTAEVEFGPPDAFVGFVVVDPDDCVFEFDETNNTRRY
jgi:hypothetical protein